MFRKLCRMWHDVPFLIHVTVNAAGLLKSWSPAAASLHLFVFSCASTAEFSIWTREAGAGGLSIAVEGPSKAEIAFEDHKDGSCGVSYIVQEPGTHQDQNVLK